MTLTPSRSTEVHVEAETVVEPVAETDLIIAEMRRAVQGGEHWFSALMAAIRQWPLPVEQVGERSYRYLVGGEAFDWLLLAERLCEEMTDLVPEDEAEELLFHGRLPIEADAVEFERLLGAKHRAHLNFIYGVRVEEALQLAVQAEVHKERQSRVWENGYLDEEVYTSIYGASRPALLAEFRCERNLAPEENISLADFQEFTYWLFKHRVKDHDPARVASDTRKGVAELQRMEERRTRAGTPQSVTPADEP